MHKYIFVNSTEKVRKRPTEETKFGQLRKRNSANWGNEIYKVLKISEKWTYRLSCGFRSFRVWSIFVWPMIIRENLRCIHLGFKRSKQKRMTSFQSWCGKSRFLSKKNGRMFVGWIFYATFADRYEPIWGMRPSVARVTFCAMSHKINNLTTIWWPTYPTSFLAFIFTLPNKRSGMSRANINDI